jgi:NADH:ubiquinone oxidoreductase subunit 5 (subunit L)/multisubunit Na+/H+ antiporter MnhA subunit
MVVLGRLGLGAALVLPVAGLVIAGMLGGASGRARRVVVGLGWAATLGALGGLVAVAAGAPFGLLERGRTGSVVVGLWADQLTVTLLVLVCGVGALVQSFAVRSLQGDPRVGRFLAGTSGVVAAMVLVCSAATLPLLVGGWVAAGVAFVAVLGCRGDLPGVRQATWRTAWLFGLGDTGLVVAGVLVAWRVGNLDLVDARALEAAPGRLGDLGTVVALLLVGAALTRSAQWVLGRWLPGTVAAPTPASALLHAGVVNGGGILLVRTGALAGASLPAMVVLFVAAGSSAAVAAQLMTRRPDVKGSLVYSTKSQMGFMLAEYAVGAWLAAVVHLVGHALYKATLFLGSGSQVPRLGQAPAAPRRALPGLLRAGLAGVSAGAAVGVMVAVPGALADRGAAVLVVFAALSAAAAAWSWWERPATLGWAVLGVGGLLGASGLYGLVLWGLGRWLGPALPGGAAGLLSPWWLLVMAGAGLVALGALRVPWLAERLVPVLVDRAAPERLGSGLWWEGVV